MTDHSQIWHDGASSRRKISGNYEGLATIIAQLSSLGREIKKLSKHVHYVRISCELCNGSHLSKDCPNKEQVKKAEDRDGKINPNPKGKPETRTNWGGTGHAYRGTPITKAVVAPYRPPTPFDSRLVEGKSVDQDADVLTSLKKLKVNIAFVEALKGMPEYSRDLEDLLKNKSMIDDEEKAK
ncbi:hypothetical protein Tco_0966261 [Tanacetum coccineum]